MNRRHVLITGACALAVPAIARAQDPITQKFINKPEDGWTIYGPQTDKTVKDKDINGGRAIEVKIASANGNIWEAAAQTAIIKPIKKGDKILGVVNLRAATESGGPASLNLRLQINTAPYSDFGQKSISVGPTWQQYAIDTVAPQDYAANTTVMVIHLASGKQSIFLGPGIVLNMGQ